REWLLRAARGAGVTPAHVVLPLLSIASSLVGAARQVEASKSWSEPLSLWTAVVGHSGTGKTPGLDVTRRALTRIERNRRESDAELRHAHAERAAAAKVALKKWRHAAERAIEHGHQMPPKPLESDDPGPFVAPRLWASDVTIA